MYVYYIMYYKREVVRLTSNAYLSTILPFARNSNFTRYFHTTGDELAYKHAETFESLEKLLTTQHYTLVLISIHNNVLKRK